MYHDLWSAAYEHTKERSAEVILAAAHRLLAKEGGEPAVVLAASMLATVPSTQRQPLLDKFVEHDLHAEIIGILEADPGNKNTAVVHDAILLGQYSRPSFEGDLKTLYALLPRFRTQSARDEAQFYIKEREHDVHQTLREHALPLQHSQTTSTDHWAYQAATHATKHTTITAFGIPLGTNALRPSLAADMVAKALEKQHKRAHLYLYWTDLRPLQTLPKHTPKPEVLHKYLGMPLAEAADTIDNAHPSIAQHVIAEHAGLLLQCASFPEQQLQSTWYAKGTYTDAVDTVLQRHDDLQHALDEQENWRAYHVRCQSCLKEEAQLTNYTQFMVAYTCRCGYSATVDLRKHALIRLEPSIELAAYWYKQPTDVCVLGVPYTDADVRKATTAAHVLWQLVPPHTVLCAALSTEATTETLGMLYTAEVLRHAIAAADPTETVRLPTDAGWLHLYQQFDDTEEQYFTSGAQANTYALSVVLEPQTQPMHAAMEKLLEYSQLVAENTAALVAIYRDELHQPLDEVRLRNRARAGLEWLHRYAPDNYQLRLATKPHEIALEAPVRDALRELAGTLGSQDEQELVELFTTLAQKHGIPLTEFFKNAYAVLFGKTHGPKLSHVITIAGHERVRTVLAQL